MQSEEEFLSALAERPKDRALRLVFSDWLLERGDPRGEAIALGEKEHPTGFERRRLEKLQHVNAKAWLGPLAEVAVADKCRFSGGLLHTLRLPANLAAQQYQKVTGEVRLGTVEAVTIDRGRVASQVGGFFAHRVLRHLVRLDVDIGCALAAEGFSSAPAELEITLWHPHEDLAALAGCAPLQAAKVLAIATVETLTPLFAEELASAVLTSGVIAGRQRLEVVPTFSTLEGAAAWLRMSSQVQGEARGKLERWAVTYADVVLGLQGARFESLTIDLESDSDFHVKTQVGTAASVLVQLGDLGIARVEVRNVPGGRLERNELDALRAAGRRLTTLEDFTVAGVPLSP